MNLRTGVVVVGHGSRREEANDDLREAARQIGVRGGFALVEPAFLEIVRPTIDEAFTRCVESGATHIIVHPYFLSPGRHTRGDLPVEVSSAASRHCHVTYQITEPLAAHPLVIDASIERIRETVVPEVTYPRAGKVYLVGAGPGDPGLLTVRALELLRRADVVIYDYLVNPELLVHVRSGSERIFVGKVGHSRQTPQSEINSLLIAHARKGQRVVRLKGGDPFLFGRGGEEAQALRSAGIHYEVVPGISSALAVPAYAGIPLTHRGVSSSVAVVTGARAGEGMFTEDLKNCNAETLVILMGVAHLRRIVSELVDSGRHKETPVAIIRWGTYEAQRTLMGTLGNIADLVEREGLRAPAVIVVGEVVQLRDQLQWFERKVSGGVTLDDDCELRDGLCNFV